MRKIIAILFVTSLGAIGCRHVGGKCDCGPTPGEAGVYAPYSTPPVKAAVETIPAKELPKK